MRDSDAWYLGVIGVLTAAFFGLLAVPDADIAWSTKWPIDASIGVGGIVGSIVYFAFIRKFNPAEAAERAGQIAAYHNKVRELVWVPWIQETAGYPFVATANVTIRPVFQPLVGANERYFQSAQEHLSAYESANCSTRGTPSLRLRVRWCACD